MEVNLETTIKYLLEQGKISVRTYNCLTNAGMDTLGDVLNRFTKQEDLLSLPKFGRKSYTEIEPILNVVMHSSEKPAQRVQETLFTALNDQLEDIINKVYLMVTEGEGSVKNYLQTTFKEPRDLHYLVMGDLENMLRVVEGYSREENLAIRHTYKQYIALVLHEMEETDCVTNEVYEKYKRKKTELEHKIEQFSYEQVALYFLSPIARNFIESIFQKKKETMLSVRCRNFVNKFAPHFSDLIKFAEVPLSNYRNLCPGHSMNKTLRELYQFNQDFKHDFDRISLLSDDEILSEILIRDYPFLRDEQRQFVFDFIKENDHQPLLFLLLHYLRQSENKLNKIYSLYYGITDGKSRMTNEISKIVGLTRERCRQIIRWKIEAHESAIVKNKDWDCYQALFELPFVYAQTEEYLRLKEKEHLFEDFNIFAALVSLKGNFMMENVEGHTILINKDVEDFNFNNCLKSLLDIINGKYSADTYVSLEPILNAIPEALKTDVATLMRYIAKEIYNVRLTEDGQLLLKQNFIDIPEELYDILLKNGKPMHVEEIFRIFKERYPNHKYTEALQIKPSMYKHKHIRSIGKTSHYALDSWDGIYFGSIRNLLTDLLDASDKPLHIDILYEGVCKYYPNTSKSSVASTMENETMQRFVEFEGRYFGLTSKQYSDEYVLAPEVRRYQFEDRFKMFKDFVDVNHRFPCYSDHDEEASMMRWFYNITRGVITITDEQRQMLNEMVAHYDTLGYPRTATEHIFLLKCQELKAYYRQNQTLPSSKNAPELYAWLCRARGKYNSYTDKRRQYFSDLINNLFPFGF